MARKDLRKLKRLELLDMMIEQGKQLEQQTTRADELEKRVKKLEVQLQASEDRIGHLKEQLTDAATVNDRLRAKERAANQDSAKAVQDVRDLRRENIVLSTKLDDATRQLQRMSVAQLPSLESSDREALTSLAQRMETALEQSQAADKERTARLEAILVSQQEIIEDLTGRHAPVPEARSVAPAEPAPKPAEVEIPAIEPVVPAFRIGPLGKKKKKKSK